MDRWHVCFKNFLTIVILLVSFYLLRDLPLLYFLQPNLVFLSYILKDSSITSSPSYYPNCFSVDLFVPFLSFRLLNPHIIAHCILKLISKTDQNSHMEQLYTLQRFKYTFPILFNLIFLAPPCEEFYMGIFY